MTEAFPRCDQKNIKIFLLILCIYTGFIVIESKSSTQNQCHEVWYFKLFGSLLRCIHYDMKDAYLLFFLERKWSPITKCLLTSHFLLAKKKKTQSFSFINVLFNMQLQLGTHVENSKIYRQTFMFAHKYTQLLLLKEEKKKN